MLFTDVSVSVGVANSDQNPCVLVIPVSAVFCPGQITVSPVTDIVSIIGETTISST
ncbi:MAG: hypothetical protein IPG39_15180 [Bacteroidetes bacterium]|nr:hypothetical protein [Bacteroidota bacterium]